MYTYFIKHCQLVFCFFFLVRENKAHFNYITEAVLRFASNYFPYMPFCNTTLQCWHKKHQNLENFYEIESHWWQLLVLQQNFQVAGRQNSQALERSGNAFYCRSCYWMAQGNWFPNLSTDYSRLFSFIPPVSLSPIYELGFQLFTDFCRPCWL